MDRTTLQVVGILILLAGLALASLGAYRIYRNQPLSEENALPRRRTALTEEGDGRSRRNEPAPQDVELQVWKSTLEMTNASRKEKRAEGATFLLAGTIGILWGLTALYSGRGPSTQY
jgi:hypothetical protein